jgi:hypothetical protein
VLLEARIVKASTDHALLFSQEMFDRTYYRNQAYLHELPPWVVRMSEQKCFNTSLIENVASRASNLILRMGAEQRLAYTAGRQSKTPEFDGSI